MQRSTSRGTPAIPPRRISRRIFQQQPIANGSHGSIRTSPISLYLHVPFCKQQCWYCGCNMKLAARYSPVATYVQHLLREIDLIAGALPARMPVSHLHFGGGTPTVLEPEDLAAVMARLGDALSAVARCRNCDRERSAHACRFDDSSRSGRLRFNRASFGVQEFDPKVQAAINRIQPPEMVERAIKGSSRRRRAEHQFRPDLRAAASNHGGALPDRRAMRRDEARSHCAVRLRARAVGRQKSANDR